MRLPKVVPGAGDIAAACPSCAHRLAGILVQGGPLRHPISVAGAGADAATGPAYHRPSNLLLEALVALLVHTLGLISWCRRPHCAIRNQLLELELMLLLALLTFAPATCY